MAGVKRVHVHQGPFLNGMTLQIDGVSIAGSSIVSHSDVIRHS